ncbi:hypothetical protein BJ684DRAFT_7045 [Piptocephalis cylindrospora]|uniref:HECT-type E3 ubiquitin transferase n=1 Tax=Piptocephalis cylindrospora TaxID=1907219 RepID=A0A4P9Y8B9_9FUNG|nr:hypothetical protein BJ684DRAFT_7045 [Piptocephalis cylindrospora]|eukprot:RKP15406.1 hypothetical protein BJ684DRAFT_7045 [Piptocephalis cylindrospora]
MLRRGILRHIPFILPFTLRANLLRSGTHASREEEGVYLHTLAPVTIRRGHAFEDGFTFRQALSKKAKIEFIDQWGRPEEGIDGGGLFKEFMTQLVEEIFHAQVPGLFSATEQHLLYPSRLPRILAEGYGLDHYRFIGQMVGRAIWYGILLDADFAGFFLNKWIGRSNYFDDLPSLDPSVYQGLLYVKNYEGDTEEDLGLNFTLTEGEGGEEGSGETRMVELSPGGASIPVTRANRLQYVYLMANYRLNRQIDAQSRAFSEGLNQQIPRRWLGIFSTQELQHLVSGTSRYIDLDDLRTNTVYSREYTQTNHPVIARFWRVISTFPEEDLRLLLRFVTSCERAPLLGFSELEPRFCIHPSSSSQDRLPTASTCVNMLKLPSYSTDEVMKSKLLFAIRSESGFHFS